MRRRRVREIVMQGGALTERIDNTLSASTRQLPDDLNSVSNYSSPN
jgi:hypothetical protein